MSFNNVEFKSKNKFCLYIATKHLTLANLRVQSPLPYNYLFFVLYFKDRQTFCSLCAYPILYERLISVRLSFFLCYNFAQFFNNKRKLIIFVW